MPISYKINNVDEFYEAFFMDKKSSNKKINFVLASPLGKGFIKGDISKEDIIATLREFNEKNYYFNLFCCFCFW